MKLLAVIPARGGSKRLPGKNTRPFLGRPLVARAVDLAKQLPDVCDILVSTDDTAIADIGRGAGALVPWLRPAELASDTASTVDVCVHALDWYERQSGPVDGLLLLPPTSPLRRIESVREACRQFAAHPRSAVIAVAPARSHPLWCFRIEKDRMHPFIESNGLLTRSQDLPPAYVVTGGTYLIAPDLLRAGRTFYAPDIIPVIVASGEGLDVDTETDWRLAEIVAGQGGAL